MLPCWLLPSHWRWCKNDILTTLNVLGESHVTGQLGPNLLTEITSICTSINTLKPRQDGRHFADDIFKCIFLNENVWIPIKISLKFVPKGPFNNIPAMVQIMVWPRPGDRPLSEPMVVSLLTHICVARPQWVKFGYVTPSQENNGMWLLIHVLTLTAAYLNHHWG